MPKKKIELIEEEQEQQWKWDDIKTVDDIPDIIGLDNLYDSTPEDFEHIYEVNIREDITHNYDIVCQAEQIVSEMIDGQEPTYAEVAEFLQMPTQDVITIEKLYNAATFWERFVRGIILIFGEEGAGKDLLAHFLAFWFREAYGKVPILDSKPSQKFGFPVIPFSDEFLISQIKRINSMVSAKSNATAKIESSKEWHADDGQVFIKNCTFLFSEFSNVMHKMTQSNPKARLMGRIAKQWRHLEYCMITCDADKNSLDPNYFYPRVTCEIKAIQHEADDVFCYRIQPLKYNTADKALQTAGPREYVYLVGNEPHPCLNWNRPYDIYVTKNAQTIDLPKSYLKEHGG